MKLIRDIDNNRQKKLTHTLSEESILSSKKKSMTKGTCISKSMVFNYYESKEELLKIILSGFTDEIAESIAATDDSKMRKEQENILIDKYSELIMKL